MKIVHFCAGLEEWNGMANTARQFVDEERGMGHDSILTNSDKEFVSRLKTGVDKVCIHGAWLPVLWKVSKLAKRYGAELYIRPAGSYDPVRLAYHAYKKRLVSWLEHRMLSRADVVLATCQAEVGWIRAYAPEVKNIEITDLKRFFNLNHEIHEIHEKEKAIHLLYMGRRHPLKGVEHLEEAVSQFNSNHVNPVEPVKNTSTSSTRLELKVVSNVFGAEKEAVWDWCDVLVLPTLSENFGRVIAETLERGKRVITTDGAPAWDPKECEIVKVLPISNTNSQLKQEIIECLSGRMLYLRGYRDGTSATRIALLKEAIKNLTCTH